MKTIRIGAKNNPVTTPGATGWTCFVGAGGVGEETPNIMPFGAYYDFTNVRNYAGVLVTIYHTYGSNSGQPLNNIFLIDGSTWVFEYPGNWYNENTELVIGTDRIVNLSITNNNIQASGNVNAKIKVGNMITSEILAPIQPQQTVNLPFSIVIPNTWGLKPISAIINEEEFMLDPVSIIPYREKKTVTLYFTGITGEKWCPVSIEDYTVSPIITVSFPRGNSFIPISDNSVTIEYYGYCLIGVTSTYGSYYIIIRDDNIPGNPYRAPSSSLPTAKYASGLNMNPENGKSYQVDVQTGICSEI